MTSDEGARRLIFYGGSEQGSFLSMFRPFRGVDDAILVGVRQALITAAPLFQGEMLSRELIHAVWAISFLGGLWGLSPDGEIRRANRISKADLQKLEEFLEAFGLAVEFLLEGGDPDAAFARTGDDLNGAETPAPTGGLLEWMGEDTSPR